MERNHVCKKCGGIAGWDSYFQSWICTRCGDIERKPITNYDRIVSKLPKERALLLSETCPPGSGCLVCKDYTDVISGNRRCDLCWIDWLKKEATEG